MGSTRSTVRPATGRRLKREEISAALASRGKPPTNRRVCCRRPRAGARAVQGVVYSLSRRNISSDFAMAGSRPARCPRPGGPGRPAGSKIRVRAFVHSSEPVRERESDERRAYIFARTSPCGAPRPSASPPACALIVSLARTPSHPGCHLPSAPLPSRTAPTAPHTPPSLPQGCRARGDGLLHVLWRQRRHRHRRRQRRGRVLGARARVAD
jgi:hypothetical protein